MIAKCVRDEESVVWLETFNLPPTHTHTVLYANQQPSGRIGSRMSRAKKQQKYQDISRGVSRGVSRGADFILVAIEAYSVC